MLKIRRDQKDALSQAGVGRVQKCPARPGELETRRITVAQGLQFNNSDMTPWPYQEVPYGLMAKLEDRDKTWPTSMRTRAPLHLDFPGHGFEYTSKAQGVKYLVDVVNTKFEFRAALGAIDRHVVYAGHARYGRGPCFGQTDDPGENWEDGEAPPWGLYRMGYPFIGVPVREILEHKYTANLVASTIPVPVDQAETYLKRHIPWLQAKTAEDIHPELPTYAKDGDPATRWWCYRNLDDGDVEDKATGKPKQPTIGPFVVLHAGWKDTTVTPEDLGATTLNCRVFCHFGCDTFNHNHKILRDPSFKGWQREGDDHFAFWTSAIAKGDTANHWLYHLFTYPVYNAFCDWEPSLNYAVARTNVDLEQDHANYKIR